jgi:hypothetical protein
MVFINGWLETEPTLLFVKNNLDFKISLKLLCTCDLIKGITPLLFLTSLHNFEDTSHKFLSML